MTTVVQAAPSLAALMRLALLLPAGALGAAASCPGQFSMPGYGDVQMIPTGWADETLEPVDVTKKGELVAHMDARAYFADECTAGKYDHKQYVALKLLGKTIRYTVDLSGAGCGCNAAFYLTSMRQNTERSQCFDFYCDANNVCGESCAEIDIQEANQFAWHSTLHTATDHSGVGGGYGGGDGWDGPRDWGSAEYGKGASCVDTSKPFEVAASFPVDGKGVLAAMRVTLSQRGKSCPLTVRLGAYDGMAELSKALEEGMTPIVSYWSANDMLWMDGVGQDGKGPCKADDMAACGKTVKFYNFTLEDFDGEVASSGAQAAGSSGNTPPPGKTAASGYDDEPTTTPVPAPAGLSAPSGKTLTSAECPGSFKMPGYGKVSMVPNGWAEADGYTTVDVTEKGELVAHMDARAYFADECTSGKYDHRQYLALKLLGKTIRYKVDLSGAGCGCNAAFYLTSMRQNTHESECSDFYCDANNVCGESCAEIDIQEANQFAWHSTLHTATDHSGVGGGYGGGDSWDGPRDWGSSDYGKGAQCVDTTKPFEVACSFPVDSQGTLAGMEVTLSQEGRSCPLTVKLGAYEGMAELSKALEEGMTPIVSYWSANDMLWMDGVGADGQGPCRVDNMAACGESVKFYDFAVEDMSEATSQERPHAASSSGNRPPPGMTAASGYDNAVTPTPSPPVSSSRGASAAECPGSFNVPGYGKVDMVPTGWADDTFKPVDVKDGKLQAHMDARAYFADECTAGKYDHKQYLALNLLGKTMKYTVDLTDAGCGCNAAFYLTSMRQNTAASDCSDYYCDANNVCGQSCAEIDIQEANQFAWHSTLHTAQDHSGTGGGYGGGDSWDGPRDWGSAEYGKGAKCVDTTKPFQVSASFPVDAQGTLAAMEITLSQKGSSCPLAVRLGSYDGMAELSEALRDGMTPIVSYWSANDMLWMDGKGMDGQGPCAVDDVDKCGESVFFYNFSVEDIGSSSSSSTPAGAAEASAGNRPPPGHTAASGYEDTRTPAPAQHQEAVAHTCSETQNDDCRNTRCCQDAGMQCYEKNEFWAACKETCVPGSTDPEDTGDEIAPWSCVPLGKRTEGSVKAKKSKASLSATNSSKSHDGASPKGKVLVKVRTAEDLPVFSVGADAKLTIAGQRLRATLLEESSALDGSSLLQRWRDTGALAEPSRTALMPAVFAAAAALLGAMLTIAAAALAARRRASSMPRRPGQPSAWQAMRNSPAGPQSA